MSALKSFPQTKGSPYPSSTVKIMKTEFSRRTRKDELTEPVQCGLISIKWSLCRNHHFTVHHRQQRPTAARYLKKRREFTQNSRQFKCNPRRRRAAIVKKNKIILELLNRKIVHSLKVRGGGLASFRFPARKTATTHTQHRTAGPDNM